MKSNLGQSTIQDHRYTNQVSNMSWIRWARMSGSLNHSMGVSNIQGIGGTQFGQNLGVSNIGLGGAKNTLGVSNLINVQQS